MDKAYDFGDFVQDEQKSRPSGDYHSIVEVINQVIYVTGWEDVDTENGQRTLIRFKWRPNGAETALFTSSKRLHSVLASPNVKFPFATIIKVVQNRGMLGFDFRSSNEEISKQDEDTLNLLLMNKRSYVKSRKQ